MMQFAHPIYLWLLPVVLIPLILWYILKQRGATPAMHLSTVKPFAHIGTPWKAYVRHLCFALRLLAVACLIIIIARPQTRDTWRTTPTEGTDIMLVVDISSTMLARDFKPNRLDASRNIAQEFISGRPDDNIGIVIFAAEALTGMPMTVDHAALLNYISGVRIGQLPDGTAIGDGIATALNRLKEGKAKSKSIILLTDGINNRGIVMPVTAAEVAKEMGVKIYSIGVGSNTVAPMPVRTPFGIEYENVKVVIDDAALQEVADITGGKFFRATNNEMLRDVFKEIDSLEKTHMDINHFSHTEDNYMLFAWLAFAFIFIELTLRYTVTRSIP